MQDLIELIRAAVADGATAEQKAIGAQACRTILAALDAQPGKPIVLPGVPQAHPLSQLSLDQVLDLAIARLSQIAAARETQPAQPAQPGQPAAPASRAPTGLRIPMVPRGSPTAPGGARPARKKP
jgi:hypothetical protein